MQARLLIIALSFALTACSFNPFVSDNHTTGSPVGAAVGAGVGAGGVALLGGSKSLMALAGIGGGMFGYYTTTLRYDAGGVIYGCGQVYKIGDFIGIYIPTDNLFEPNTADFLPDAPIILDSAVAVLQRYPKNNIFLSGNTSGFSRPRWELKLSEKRAQRVAAYFWSSGINNFRGIDTTTRDLGYVGYGNYFRISRDLTNKGIRENSRIQISSFPSRCALGLGQKDTVMSNYGASTDHAVDAPPCDGRFSSAGDEWDASANNCA